MASMDNNKLFFLYFLIETLDITDDLKTLTTEEKSSIIDYIYSQQCIADEDDQDYYSAGFKGGPFLGYAFHKSDLTQLPKNENSIHNTGNLIYTFPALACLTILDDDLSRVQKTRLIKSLKLYQNEDGR